MTPGNARQRARQTITATLAATFACDPAAWSDERNTIVAATALPGRLRFPIPSRPFLLASCGAGAVISCHESRLGWARAELAPQGRDALFSLPLLAEIDRQLRRDGQRLHGPLLRFACDEDNFRPAPPPDGITLTLHQGEDIRELYVYRGFENALEYDHASPRPDVLAVAAWQGQSLVGIAGASADSDDLWQLGVDVATAARGVGVGRALVGTLTDAVLAAGKVPYYSTTVAHLRSAAIALGLGYWLAWSDLFARDER
ncbi:MAG TPA: GNAT family N-acetyltransferase [Thermomicrobiales bacterium]|jgi:GNAT superfamily N-acetyltransferase